MMPPESHIPAWNPEKSLKGGRFRPRGVKFDPRTPKHTPALIPGPKSWKPLPRPALRDGVNRAGGAARPPLFFLHRNLPSRFFVGMVILLDHCAGLLRPRSAQHSVSGTGGIERPLALKIGTQGFTRPTTGKIILSAILCFLSTNF